jgi:hypothetical protein
MSRSILALVLLLALAGCSADTITEPLPTGTMVGKAMRYSVKEPIFDHSGTRVTLEGTSFETITDRNGEWRIDGVPTRTHTVIYQRDGYGLMKQPMVTFVGGGVLRVQTVNLTAIPKCGAIFDAVRQIDTFYIEAHAHPRCSDLDSNLGFINDYVLFVFSNSPDVSAEPDKHTFAQLANTPIPGGTATASLAKQQIQQYLNIEDTIYIAAYNAGGSAWMDPLTDRTIYTSWNPERDRVLAIKWNNE